MTRFRKPKLEMAMPAAMMRAADRAEPCGHGIGCRRATLRQTGDAESSEISQVRQQVHCDHDAHACDQGPRQIPFWLDQLFRDEVGLLPAAKREQHRNQGRSEQHQCRYSAAVAVPARRHRWQRQR